MIRKFIISFLIGWVSAFAIWLFLVLFYIPKQEVGLYQGGEPWLYDVLRCKLDIAKNTPSPKIIILAGSNAFWGMKCGLIEKELGKPIVNMSFHGGFSIDFYPSSL